DPTAAQRKAIRRVVAEGDFEMVFQSVHDVATGKVVGVEALARLLEEQVGPEGLTGEAGELGLGIELETAIVRRILAKVPKLPADAFVAINISPAAALR
ncbi:diguanylate phosphodiesterase, partial [Mycobacterium sp. ITM-2017-0098]